MYIVDCWDEKGEYYIVIVEDVVYGIFEIFGGVIVEINFLWIVCVNWDEFVEF